jgi:hypothetical protein
VGLFKVNVFFYNDISMLYDGLAEGVGFIHSLENIEKFSAEWQT